MERNNNPWLSFVTEILSSIPHISTEQAYYGPYNALLGQAFPPLDRYMVVPSTHPNSRKDVNFLVEHIAIDRRVVMVVEIKRENIIHYEHARMEADLQIRDRLRFIHENVIPELIGISIFGRFCRVYRYIRATKQITSDSGEDLHSDRWNINLYSESGRTKLAVIFENVRTRVTQEF